MATIAERLMMARAELAAAQSAVTADDRAEIEARAELAALEAKRAEAERERRDLDLERREDAAREALGPKAKISALAIDCYPDTFVLAYQPAAYRAWEATLNSGRKYDRVATNLALVTACVHDWNGITDWTTMVRNAAGGETPAGAALSAYLKENQGMLQPLVNEIGRLAGLFKEARKSGSQ